MTNSTDVSTEVVVFASGKGGTGKTSLIAALGYALRYSGHSVLMIDADRATDGFSLFILGPHGMNQLADYKPQNTFIGILEQFERSRQIDAEPRIVHRSGPNDHDLSYKAIISGKGLYGDALSPTDDAPNESWNHQFDRGTFQKGVQELFEMLRVQRLYDYVLVDSRGGFAFESTDVTAAADSFVIVTEATNTNFYQDRNLVDRINAAAEQMKTRPLLRGIIVNKATEPPEISYRQELVREFQVRLEDTFPVAWDVVAAAVYKTQKIIYREAPASRFAYDSLQAFQQILKVVTSQWPEDRARRWNELVTNVDAAIAKHNAEIAKHDAEVEAEKRREQERIAQFHALETERATLKSEMANLKDAHEQEKRRQDILFEELKAQARQRGEAAERERARDQERLRDEKANHAREIERLALQLRERERDVVDARDQVRSLERAVMERERAVRKARLYAAIIPLIGILLTSAAAYIVYTSALSAWPPPEPIPAGDPLVAKGRELFFKETFDGNGRTCGTCHRAENNLTIDPAFIATLPDNDPLFVAEFIPELANNFENPNLMRKRGLILENLDGTDKPGVMRGVPHVFAQRFSIDSNPRNRLECFNDTLCPRTGWSGDGAPETEDLKAFARGAVTQHFTKTTNRKKGVDFRPPTEDEAKALEAFQLSLGRQEELKLPLPLKSAEAVKGQEIFNSAGKCFRCHANAGANIPPGGLATGNLNFNTGVENLPDPTGDFSQPDDGLGITPAGDGTFNTPSLVEAADTGPFFHNNSVDTIEGAVAFYNTDAFNNSPSGQFLSGGTGRAIALDGGTQVKAVAAFLRAINALDNIRELNKLLGAVEANVLLAGEHPADVVKRAVHDIDDAIMVLQDGGLHPDAVQQLQEARRLTVEADTSPSSRIELAKQALDAINHAKSLILG